MLLEEFRNAKSEKHSTNGFRPFELLFTDENPIKWNSSHEAGCYRPQDSTTQVLIGESFGKSKMQLSSISSGGGVRERALWVFKREKAQAWTIIIYVDVNWINGLKQRKQIVNYSVRTWCLCVYVEGPPSLKWRSGPLENYKLRLTWTFFTRWEVVCGKWDQASNEIIF